MLTRTVGIYIHLHMTLNPEDQYRQSLFIAVGTSVLITEDPVSRNFNHRFNQSLCAYFSRNIFCVLEREIITNAWLRFQTVSMNLILMIRH